MTLASSTSRDHPISDVLVVLGAGIMALSLLVHLVAIPFAFYLLFTGN